MRLRLGHASRRADASRSACRASYLFRDATREVAVTQPKKKAVSPESKALDEWIPSDATRPWYMTVRKAFIQRFAEWYACTGYGTLHDSKCLEQPWRILAGLLFRDPPATRNHDWRDLRTQPQIVRVLRHVLRTAGDHPTRGRPRSDLRRLAVQALDLRHEDIKRWTWRQLATHFDIYKCSERGHDPDCQKKWEDYRKCRRRRENDLKREALFLKESLRELRVKLPARRNNR